MESSSGSQTSTLRISASCGYNCCLFILSSRVLFQTIIGFDVTSFLSIPILHTHQEKTRVLKRRKTSSIFYEPEKETEAESSAASNGVGRGDSAPCVALLVCLVNK